MIAKPIVKLLYNGKDCTSDFSKYLNTLSFQDFEDEQSDELNITLNDNDGFFADLWYPEKGDKLTCSIDFDGSAFDCGACTIDENSFDFSVSGDTVQIKALSTSTNYSVRTAQIKNHSGKTLRQIANEAGASYGFKVLGEGGEEKISNIVQKNESDIAFLKRIAKMYGYIFNIKDGALTFIKLDEIEAQEPLFTLDKTDCSRISLNDSVTKLYGKARVQYFDSASKSLKTYTAQGNTELTDVLNIYKKCNSLEEARRIAAACLKNGSKEITGSIELALPLKHNPSPLEGEGLGGGHSYSPVSYFCAGINFNLTGIGKFTGMYHIKSSTRTIDSNGLKIKGVKNVYNRHYHRNIRT